MAYAGLIELTAYRLVDSIEVVAGGAGQGQLNEPQTLVTFGAGGDGYHQSQLSGVGRVDYLVEADLFLIQDSPGIQLELNGVVTDQAALQRDTHALINTGVVASPSPFPIAGIGASPNPYTGRITFRFRAEDGVNRSYLGNLQGLRRDGATGTGNLQLRDQFGTWESPGSSLSSAVIRSVVADALGAGTLFSLYEIDRRF